MAEQVTVQVASLVMYRGDRDKIMSAGGLSSALVLRRDQSEHLDRMVGISTKGDRSSSSVRV